MTLADEVEALCPCNCHECPDGALALTCASSMCGEFRDLARRVREMEQKLEKTELTLELVNATFNECL